MKTSKLMLATLAIALLTATGAVAQDFYATPRLRGGHNLSTGGFVIPRLGGGFNMSNGGYSTPRSGGNNSLFELSSD